jgi:hypothetical protein
MGTLPRPLLALLVAVLAAFAAWTTVLKPKSQSSASNTQVSNAVKQGASHVKQHAAAKPATHVASAAATKAAAKAQATERHAKAVAAKQASAAQKRSAHVTSALRADKVVALLFYNPAGADDRADLKELSAVPTHKGKVVTVAVPLSELSRYGEVTNQVPVQGSPTFVVIDGKHRASTLVGFADQLELNQLVAGAIAAK